MQNKVVIVSAVRTPLGCFMGSLSNFSAVDLGIYALEGALSKIDFDKKEIDDHDKQLKFTEAGEDLPSPIDIRGLVKNSMQRAKGGRSVKRRTRRKIPHNIDDEDWIAEKEKLTHCEVTGIEFTLDTRGPFQRSLDQRIPGMGYTKENTDVVVLIYNYAKNDFEPDDVLLFCKQYAANMR